MANEGAKFLKYGRHVKADGKPANYREHIKKMAKKIPLTDKK